MERKCLKVALGTCVFGHVYHYLSTVGGIGRCPQFVRDWYENGDDGLVEAIRGEYKKISSDFEMQ